MHTPLPAPGDVVWIRQRRWRVRRASRHRSVVRLDVFARHERLTFLAPFDRPSAVSAAGRPRRIRRQGALARLAHVLARAYGVRTLLSMVDANVTLLPYQLEPALAIVHGTRRVLVADDVGLGKTIQAGVVIAELMRRAPSCRILVLVPAPLAEQWAGELSRRFDVTARAVDRARLDAMVAAGGRGENPWRSSGVWIASLDYIKQPHVLAGLPPRPWDLVVFDEAHGVCGESERHAAADGLARRARHVLMLTATPHDGDERRFTRLTTLGRQDDDLTVFRRTRSDLASAATRRVRWHHVALSAAERRVLDALGDFERSVLAAAGAARREAALLLLSVFRKRAVSTMSALSVSLERRRAWLERPDRDIAPDWVQPSLAFGDDGSDEIGNEDTQSLAAAVGLDPRQERAWLKRLCALATAATRDERKIARLAALLTKSSEPAVVFTEFRHSLEAVRRRIDAIRPVAVLHGGQTPVERAQQLNRFLDGSASVLLGTDVASLGLNLQRSRWAISLELPWNPTRLEQRVGRIDRIGQTRDVHFTLLVADHDAERAVLARLARRTLVAQRTLGGDVLRSVQPDAALLCDAVIAGVPPGPPAADGPAVARCRRWARPARVAAITLERRRRLAARWRSRDAVQGRPGVVPLRHGPATCVFSVPIVDGAGAPIEEHVVAVRLPHLTADVYSTKLITDARNLAARHAMPHAARVQRWQRHRQQVSAATERAIVAAIDPETRLGEVQPGLFDRRALRAFEVARDTAADLRKDERAWITDGDRIAVARVGSPRLVLLLATPASLGDRSS